MWDAWKYGNKLKLRFLFQVITLMFMSLGTSVKQPKGALEELDSTTNGLCVQGYQQAFMLLRRKLLTVCKKAA